MNRLLKFQERISVLEEAIKQFPWHYDGPCERLMTSHLANALNRFLREEISATDVENWANFIECREDIDFEEGQEETFTDVLFELANSTLQGELTKQSCRGLLSRLS